MVKNKARTYEGKLRRREGKRVDIAGQPAYVFEALFLLRFMRLLQHRGRHIDTSNMLCHPGKGTCQQAEPACYVQNCVFRAGTGPLHNAVQRLFVAAGWRGGEWNRLAGELVENAGVVRTHV